MQRQIIELRIVETVNGPEIVDIESYAPGFFISFIRIDNPTGSWLFVETLHQWIAPYRIGWSRVIPWQTQTITVRAVEGPLGSPSTPAGQPGTIWLYDYIAGNETDGYAVYGYDLQPPTIIAANGTAAFFPAFSPATPNFFSLVVGANATKRLRVYDIALRQFQDPTSAIGNPLLTHRVICVVSSQGFEMQLTIDPNRLVDRWAYTPPVDLDPGQDVGYFAFLDGPNATNDAEIVDVRLHYALL